MRSASAKIVVGVCGSIAAYKACEVIRGLVLSGAEVRCVMTPSAARFITPLSLSALSGNPVVSDLFAPRDSPGSTADRNGPPSWGMVHLELAGWADLIVVAPATADFIARAASGRAEGALDAVLLSVPPDHLGKIALVPAMDSEMWIHPATQENLGRLKSFGYLVWGPDEGRLASGRAGLGRMLEPQEVIRRALDQLGGGYPSKARAAAKA